MCEFDKKEDVKTINKNDKNTRIKNYNKSNLMYDSNHNFYKYYDIKIFDNHSFESKFSSLVDFLMI